MKRSPPNRKKFFFSFEGIDGCGKSVQAAALAENLRKADYSVSLIREPGSTGISEKIRELLLDRDNNNMSPLTELLLYEAARAQLVSEKINPLENNNKIIIADRFLDSSIAYQGFGRSIPIEIIKKINSFVCGSTIPDRTYILYVSWEESLRRRKKNLKKNDRIENQHRLFFHRVQEGYMNLAKKEPDRIMLLQGEKSIDTLKNIIFKDAISKLEKIKPRRTRREENTKTRSTQRQEKKNTNDTKK